MSQSVMSTDSTISFFVAIDHHGTRSTIFLAVRNGGSVGDSPSMTRFSTMKVPGIRRADRLPIRIGRCM